MFTNILNTSRREINLSNSVKCVFLSLFSYFLVVTSFSPLSRKLQSKTERRLSPLHSTAHKLLQLLTLKVAALSTCSPHRWSFLVLQVSLNFLWFFFLQRIHFEQIVRHAQNEKLKNDEKLKEENVFPHDPSLFATSTSHLIQSMFSNIFCRERHTREGRGKRSWIHLNSLLINGLEEEVWKQQFNLIYSDVFLKVKSSLKENFPFNFDWFRVTLQYCLWNVFWF